MRIFNIIIIILFIFNHGYSQTKQVSVGIKNNPDSFSEVLTPFGPALKSNVHFVSKGNHINNKHYSTQIVQTSTGKVIEEFENQISSENTGSKGSSIENETSNSQLGFPDGWLTYGFGSTDSPTKTPISLFRTKWYVPSEPIKESDQLIYIFCGLETIDDYGISRIVQPVLQWGKSPAGGGKYWTICNWYVSSDYNFFYDSLINVSPRTLLEGKIQLMSISDNQFNYFSSFTGFSTGLTINSLPELKSPCIVLETYNLKECEELPIDEKIRMFNILVKTDTLNRNLAWSVYNNNSVQNSCSQYTKILSENSTNGELDIHLRSPVDLDKFDLIHIYPNPCNKFLHVSPTRVIKNCRVEIYNEFGRLEKSDYFENMEYEVNLDMENLASGIYLIKFSYNYSTHTFKVIKR